MFRRYPRISGVVLGLAVMATSLAVLFHTDFGQRLELQTFDLRVRHCTQLQPASPILHVDIDDGALERVRRWPWHRDEIAQIVGALSELGAENIMIDFLFNEPEEPYLQVSRVQAFENTEESLGEFTEADRVFPDRELAAAMEGAGNVILAMHMKIDAAQVSMDEPPEEKQLLARVRARLLTNFTMTDQDLARALNVTPAKINRVFARAKSDAAGQLVQDMIIGGRVPSPDEAFEKILGPRKDIINADRSDVQKALYTANGLVAASRRWPRVPENCRAKVATASEGVPPCPLFADAVASVAAVNYIPDADGLDRRVPLLIKYRDQFVPHMGLEAAVRILKLDLNHISFPNQHTLVIPAHEGPGITIPLDTEGNMLINWAATAGDWKKGRDFEHITAAKLYELIEARNIIHKNRTLRDFLLAEVVAAAKGEIAISAASGPSTTLHADNPFRKKINDLLDLERRIHLARLRQGNTDHAENRPPTSAVSDKTHSPQSAAVVEWEKQAAQLRDEIAREQNQAIAAVKLAGQDLAGITPEEFAKDPSLKQLAERFRPALAIIEKDLPTIDEANHKLEESAVVTRAALAEKIKGKHVFLGFAATAEGDIVPTPIDHRTNGVMCHSHVLNGILQNNFIAPASRTSEWIVAAALGAAVSLVTATRGPRLALLATLAAMVGYALIVCYILFMKAGIWFALAAPLITLFITWAFVTLFRQLTAEREKRLFAKQLSQYTSPIIAARIAENPEAVAAFKKVTTRQMTIFFSDLAGFTTLSEQEDAETIQRVLNTYLERMSHVIWAHRGLINKFMGDGIMAFFNPSVDPLADHARISCETSLATIEELGRLKAEFIGDPASRVFDKLSMRIGLSTGSCKNGDLGSELKADYTVIGDVVNLAARLEPANKVFGTQIMVSGPLRELTKNDFDYRYLAELQVKGKASTVPVYELICRRGQLDDEQRQYIERFEAGVELYKARKWDECIVHFTRILSRRFDDMGASRYVDACQEFKRFPPDEKWTGALELKEK